ncbi:putative outer membrane protein TolC [Mucinivorans hirudinis]|uniref:Putative outer membrane protein TolC n=1 Tax=Mucinivorans hirudinis TaxID=1433126 RepID=A0A060R979_9BACT|nr:putative outer membrane protein TolC [Mucinivorans hirudinis]
MSLSVSAQERISVSHSLEEVIDLAMENSIDAMVARHSFLGSYWQYRTYRAQFLPKFSLDGTLPSFDRSLVSLQDPNTGEYKYVQNYAMRNSLGLNVIQNIGLTGGTVSLSSGLDRLDQYAPQHGVYYNSSPISLILNQPIGAFNRLKWDKKIEPVRYELAKFNFLEARESIINYAVTLFFNQLVAQQNLEMARVNHASTDTLFRISKRRFELGAITHSDLLQLELRLLNEGIAINENQLQLNLAQARLRSYLGYNERVDITLRVPEDVPELNISLDSAYRLTMDNTSFAYRQKVSRLEAEKAVAQAKAEHNPQFNLYARFGLNQVAKDLAGAYRNPLDQETVRLGISVPIFDGGVSKGRVKMSLSQQDVVEATLEKDAIDRRQDIYLKVMQFNNQGMQCGISRRADEVSAERYRISTEQFAEGKLSVLELNTAQSERNSAHNRLITELHNYWSYYYSIQRMTLYDFLKEQNISAEFDKITE